MNLNWLVGCRHINTSRVFTNPDTKQHRVVCTDCGLEFEYDWERMKRGKVIDGTTGTAKNTNPAIGHRSNAGKQAAQITTALDKTGTLPDMRVGGGPVLFEGSLFDALGDESGEAAGS